MIVCEGAYSGEGVDGPWKAALTHYGRMWTNLDLVVREIYVEFAIGNFSPILGNFSPILGQTAKDKVQGEETAHLVILK